MAQRSANDVCIEYAIAVAEVRRLTKALGTSICKRVIDEDFSREGTCLKNLWEMVPERNGEGNCSHEDFAEAVAELCTACAEARRLIDERRDARKRLGAAKRSVEAIGKRVAQWKAERAEQA